MKKILIVVDMQNDFITGSLANVEAQAMYPKLVKFIEEFDGPVIATLDTHYNVEPDALYLETVEGKHLPVMHCQAGTEGWKYPQELIDVIEKKDRLWVTKETFGAINIAEAVNQIAEKYFDEDEDCEFHFIGVCTDICVVTNALLIKTFFPENEVYIHENLCAGVTPEKHACAIETMRSCQCNIVED